MATASTIPLTHSNHHPTIPTNIRTIHNGSRKNSLSSANPSTTRQATTSRPSITTVLLCSESDCERKTPCVYDTWSCVLLYKLSYHKDAIFKAKNTAKYRHAGVKVLLHRIRHGTVRRGAARHGTSLLSPWNFLPHRTVLSLSRCE